MARELYPHTGDDGLDFDSPFETANLVNATGPVVGPHAQVVATLHKQLWADFPKAFARCGLPP